MLNFIETVPYCYAFNKIESWVRTGKCNGFGYRKVQLVANVLHMYRSAKLSRCQSLQGVLSLLLNVEVFDNIHVNHIS